jgi:hypothetical protein
MSKPTPVAVRLPLTMRNNTTDTREIDLYPALRLVGDTIDTITGVTVARHDGKILVDDDLRILDSPAPIKDMDALGHADSVIIWWQSVGAIADFPNDLIDTTDTSGGVDYRITVDFVTTTGRVLKYDLYQLVMASVG